MNIIINQLSNLLGYQFRHPHLLELAITHRSIRERHNERLEFLGDSVLNFIIAEAIYKKNHKAREGKLSRMRSNLVNGITLAELAKEFELSKFIQLGPGEQKSGGHLRDSILADAMEAIIGAIYLDGAFEACRERVLAWYKVRIDSVDDTNEQLKDPKTRLQEFLQRRQLPLPSYTVFKIEGEAHQQIFHIECNVPELNKVAYGSGTSRKKAEQAAAAALLGLLIDNE